jgi:DNA-directed RNA polymerase specialized sigma24 family protein
MLLLVDMAGAAVEPKNEFDQNLLLDPIAAARRALISGYGPAVGAEAADDMAVWAFANVDRLETVKNRAGYLYRVGRTCARRIKRVHDRNSGDSTWRLNTPDHSDAVVVSIELGDAMASLSRMQRSAVLLCDGYGYPLGEAAAVLCCSVSTLRNHRNRGLKRLRQAMHIDVGGGSDGRE